jgi:hypothetical protein
MWTSDMLSRWTSHPVLEQQAYMTHLRKSKQREVPAEAVEKQAYKG